VRKNLLVVLIAAIVLSTTFMTAQFLIGKVPKGYKPVEARIEGIGETQYDEFNIYTKEYLADLKAWKNIEEGTILLRFKFADVIGGHFLVRFFDRNGNYLSHLVSREMREIYGNPTDFDSKASQVIYADFEFGNVIIKTRDPDGFKYLTERVLVYPVNIRDLRDTEIICLSLAD